MQLPTGTFWRRKSGLVGDARVITFYIAVVSSCTSAASVELDTAKAAKETLSTSLAGWPSNPLEAAAGIS